MTTALALLVGAVAGAAPAFATSVSSVSVAPSTTAAGATGVFYTVDFTTSFAGGLVSPTGRDHVDRAGGDVHRRQLHRGGHDARQPQPRRQRLKQRHDCRLDDRQLDRDRAGRRAPGQDHKRHQLHRRAAHLRRQHLLRHRRRHLTVLHPGRGADGLEHVGGNLDARGRGHGRHLCRRLHYQLDRSAGVPGQDHADRAGGNVHRRQLHGPRRDRQQPQPRRRHVSNNGTTVVLRSAARPPPRRATRSRSGSRTPPTSTAGPHTFDISTSSDTTPVTTPAYNLVAAQTVGARRSLPRHRRPGPRASPMPWTSRPARPVSWCSRARSR